MMVAAGLLAGSVSAQAEVFDVKAPEIKKGEREIGENFSAMNGFPANASKTRYSLELSGSYAPTDWFKMTAKMNLDKPLDDAWQWSTAGAEVQFSFGEPIKGVSLGWFTGIDARVYESETNSITFGPIIQFGDEKRSVTLNPFLEQTFGPNHDEGIAFSYAWQAKMALREGFAIGVEGYGKINDLGNSPPSSNQEHRIGPVLYFDGQFKRGKDDAGWAIELGVLAGLTEGTPDTTAKLKAAVTF